MFRIVKVVNDGSRAVYVVKYTVDRYGKRLHDVFPVILDDENEEIVIVYCPNNNHTLVPDFVEEYKARVVTPDELEDPSVCEEAAELRRQLLAPRCWRPAK